MATVFKLSVSHINGNQVSGVGGTDYQTFFLPATSIESIIGNDYNVRHKGALGGGTYATLTQKDGEEIVSYDTASDIVKLPVSRVDVKRIDTTDYTLNLSKVLYIRENQDGTIETIVNVDTSSTVYTIDSDISTIDGIFDADDVVIPSVDTSFLGYVSVVTENTTYASTDKNKLISLVDCSITLDEEGDFPFERGDKFAVYAGTGDCSLGALINASYESISMNVGETVIVAVVEYNENLVLQAITQLVYDTEDETWKTLARYESDGLYKRDRIEFACSDEVTPLEVAEDLIKKEAGVAILVKEIRLFLSTPQATGTTLKIDILKNGVTMLEDPLEFTNTEAVKIGTENVEILANTTLAVSDVISVDCTAVGDSTACGLKVIIIGRPI